MSTLADRLSLPGVAGLGTLKNLVEAGFDAVGFERNEYVGGLWHWTSNKGITSVSKSKVDARLR